MDMSVVVILFSFFIVCGAQFVEEKQIEFLVKKWAPLIWLSPEEKFMPLGVEDFLQNMKISDENGKFERNLHDDILTYSTKYWFLVTKKSLDSLKENATSFLHGKNPKENSVPVYALVTYCSPYISFHTSDYKNVQSDINNIYGKTLPNLNFHVSYWVFFPFNKGKDICFLGKVPGPYLFNTCFGKLKTVGSHIGDWEHMSLSFRGTVVPHRMYLAVHDAGIYYKYDKNQHVFKYESQITLKGVSQRPKASALIRNQGGHPVLFSANGSHGLWSTPGIHDYVRVPRLSDKTGFGVPWKTWNTVQIYHLGISKLPNWMRFKGKWGNPKSNCFLFKKLGLCEYFDGPTGLLRKPQDFHC